MRLTTSEALSRVRPTEYEEMVYSTWLSQIYELRTQQHMYIHDGVFWILDNEIYNLLS